MRAAAPFPAAVLLLAAALAQPAGAVDRYVNAVTGTDTGPAADCRTAAQPCRTISHALSLADLAPGDRVRVGPGTYDTGLGERFPLVLPAGVVLEGTAGADRTAIVDDDSSANPANRIGLRLTLGETTAEPSGVSGFSVDGLGLAGNHYGVWIESVAPMRGTPPPYLRDCVLRGFTASAVVLATWGTGLASVPSRLEALVERNRIWPGSAGSGIQVLAISDDGVTGAEDHSILRNNILLGGGLGIRIAAEPGALGNPSGLAFARTVLRHLTISGASGDGLLLAAPDARGGQPAVAVELANSIIAGCGGFGIAEGSPAATEAAADLSGFYGNDLDGNARGGYFDADTAAIHTTAAALNAIPDLVGLSRNNRADPPGIDLATGRLLGASALLDAGEPGWSAADDIDGQARPVGAGPDIGADEVVGMQRGAFSNLAPLTPGRGFFATLPGYLVAGASPWADPEAGVLDDPSRPLIAYAFPAGSSVVLRMVKDSATRSVTLVY